MLTVRSLVHGDFRAKNLIYEIGSCSIKAVIDFEWCFNGSPFYDLGLMLVEWSCPDSQTYFNREIIKAILDGYSEVIGRKINLDEKIKFWMYYSALSDSSTYLLRVARKAFVEGKKINQRLYMYDKARMALNL